MSIRVLSGYWEKLNVLQMLDEDSYARNDYFVYRRKLVSVCTNIEVLIVTELIHSGIHRLHIVV